MKQVINRPLAIPPFLFGAGVADYRRHKIGCLKIGEEELPEGKKQFWIVWFLVNGTVTPEVVLDGVMLGVLELIETHKLEASSDTKQVINRPLAIPPFLFGAGVADYRRHKIGCLKIGEEGLPEERTQFWIIWVLVNGTVTPEVVLDGVVLGVL
ncbi:hypothetical protein CDAR_577691 [Caerostris darwini]|uniref:Uncharacterized protein n=1 Tax=Caerostris darwini TaxID=1538125 RepID=A0AAV4RGE1_9ARAC|nr:hypothetical protein CDAR_577691 [Caerostris darwini]